MLSELIRLLEESPGEIDIQSLSREMRAEPGAVEGMLAFLVAKGRLIPFDSGCGICETCALRKDCALPTRRVRRYRLETLPVEGSNG